MEELNEMIKRIGEKKRKDIIGCEPNCSCSFEVPNYSRVCVLSKIDHTFLWINRYYCPVCGEEFVKN